MRRTSAMLFAGILLTGGCKDDEDVFHPNVLTPAGYGAYYDPQPSLTSGYATQDEVAAALDAGVEKFILLHPDLNAGVVREVARALEWRIVDDYGFEASYNTSGVVWAAGETDLESKITLALWSRGTTEGAANPADKAFVPLETPLHTVRPPDDHNFGYWRYGIRPLLPALLHELGHIFHGPCFEHPNCS